MDNRDAIGSWLSGPRAAAEDAGVEFGYRGRQLGLPEEGPGSIARPGRRFGALVVDWALCLLIAYGLVARGDRQSVANWTLLIFFVLSALTVGTLGSTPGKRIFRMRVVAVDGARLSFLWGLVRSVLLCLAIPALIWDRDGRGLHDKAARAVEVRM